MHLKLSTSAPLLALALLALLAGCQGGGDGFFPKQIELRHRAGGYDGPALTSCNIKALGRVFVVMDVFSKDTVFRLLDRQDFRLLASFGKIGHGEGEIVSPGFFAVDSSSNSVFLMDHGRKQIVAYPVGSILAGQGTAPAADATPYPARLASVLSFIALPGGKVFVTTVLDDESPTLVRFDGEKLLGTLGNEPSDYAVMDTRFHFHFAKHPRQERYACAFMDKDRLAIIGRDGSAITDGPDYFEWASPTALPKWDAYSLVACSRRYVYALYSGERVKPFTPTVYRFIHVFDWGGRPVARMKLGVGISSFDLDLPNGRIVAYAEEGGAPFVYFDFQEAMLER